MPKQRYSVLLVILTSVCLNLAHSPLNALIFDDKEIFKYIGMLISKGGVPYLDVFDHKPPLIYFFYTIAYLFGPWAFWLLDTILVILASLLFYDLCRKSKLAWPVCLPLLFNLLLRYSLVSFGDGMTREYTAVFLLLFFCYLLGNLRFRYFYMGGLIGLSFWMQQDSVITMMPLIVYSVFMTGKINGISLGNRLIQLFGGCLLIVAPVIIYFAHHHALQALWDDAFVFNFHAPGLHYDLLEKIKASKHTIHEIEFELPFYSTFILALAAVFLDKGHKSLFYAGILTLILSFSAQMFSGRLLLSDGFNHYLLPLASAIPICLFICFKYSMLPFLSDKKAQFVYYSMISLTLIMGSLRYVLALPSNLSGNDSSKFPIMKYLETQSLKDNQLYVFDDSNLIALYNHFRITAPSPWIYHFFWIWTPEWDTSRRVFNSILLDLKSHQTRFIIDCSVIQHDFANKDIYIEWEQFLNQHYIPIITDNLHRKLWKIR